MEREGEINEIITESESQRERAIEREAGGGGGGQRERRREKKK